QIKLGGDYTGAHWISSGDGHGGTRVSEVPGAITSGLDTQGNPSEGQAVVVSITDGGKSVTNPHYEWQIYDTAQQKWIAGSGTGGGSANYVPGEHDEGHDLQVVIAFDNVNS